MFCEFTPPEPPQELLDRCVQILIADDKLKSKPFELKRWAQENCESFVWMNETDVSDVSIQWDYIYCFYFGTQEDANWFSLRWL